MARTTVDLTPVSPTARGIGRQGSGAVQYRANPNAGSSAELLADSLNVVLDASQRNDRRKIDEANKKFELEFDGYVSKALQGDNTTGIEELDTLYPDMSMTRKLMILKAAGKATMERDDDFQSLVASIGAPSTDEFGNSTGFANTLDGINSGYASAEQYIRDKYGESNGAYVSGMLGYLDGQRSAQVQQYVAGKRADELQATANDFSTTDKALAASGDWKTLQQRDDIWRSAGGNDFIQGKTRNAEILNAAHDQALLNRDIGVLKDAPEVYKGIMKDKPQLWDTYMSNVQREIDRLNAVDAAATLKKKEDEQKLRKDTLLDKMIKGDPPLTESEIREVEGYSDLSSARERLRANTGVDKTVSKNNLVTLQGQLKEADTVEELEELGLTEAALGNPEAIIRWASTQPDIHPDDVPALIEATQSAYYITDVKNTTEHKRFEDQIAEELSFIRDPSILDPSLGQQSILGQDTTFYRQANSLAKSEFSELVEIYREENGNDKLTKKQLKEIRELVVAKVRLYVDNFRGKTVTQGAYSNQQAVEKLRDTSNEYRDPESGVIYPVISPAQAAEVMAVNPDAEFRQITANRLIQTR